MPSPSRSVFGFSLVEAIIAAFLLLTSLLVVAALVDSSLQTQAKAEQYLIASTVASTELDKLRGYSERFGVEHLDGFDGQSFPSEADAAFQATLTVSPYALAVPNSSLEAEFAEESRKMFRHSARFVQVRVAWSEDPTDHVLLSSMVSDWREQDLSITVEAEGPIEVEPHGTLKLKASSGNLKDVVYTWYTEPLVGLGSLQDVARDGQSATYVNRYRTPANRYVIYPGSCRVVVRAKYRNVVKTQEIVVENLDAPEL